MKIIPNYHPPSDYRRPTKTQEKVYVPVNDYPEINFSMITNPLTLPHLLPLHALFVMVRSMLASCFFDRDFTTLTAYCLFCFGSITNT